MAFWENILAGGAGELAKGVGTLAKDIRTAITGEEPLTAEQKARLEEQLNAMEAAAQQAALQYDTVQMAGQIEINKIEAQSDNLFKSGWRPAVGWICVAGLAIVFIVKPLFPWVCQVGALIVGKQSVVPAIPDVPMGDLLALLGGLLGLGTMRTYEKIKGRQQ